MLGKLFVDHPRSVGEGYFEHMGVAFGVGGRLFATAIKCCVHGLVPGLYKTAGSDTILTMANEITPRRFDQPTL